MSIERITHDPRVMGGKPCIRGLRVTVGTIVGLLAAKHSRERILEAYPYLEPEDIDASLEYAAWRLEAEEIEQAPITSDERLELERRLSDSLARPDAVTPWEMVKARALARGRK